MCVGWEWERGGFGAEVEKKRFGELETRVGRTGWGMNGRHLSEYKQWLPICCDH